MERDPLKQYEEVKAGGEVYYLTFDFRALIKAHEGTGLNAFQGLAQFYRPEPFAVLLRAGLLNAHPDMTLDRVYGLISDFAVLDGFMKALERAFKMSTEEPANPPAAVDGEKAVAPAEV